jgi:hypothetical protein
MGEGRRVHRFLVRARRKRRRRLEGNIRCGLQGIGWGVNWINLAQDRDNCRDFVNEVTKLRGHKTQGFFLVREGVLIS